MSDAGRTTLLVLLSLLLTYAGATAEAHQMSLSSARIELHADGTVQVEVAVKGSDADRMAGTAVFDATADRVRPEALVSGAAAGDIAAYILSHTVVAHPDGSGACRPGAPQVQPDGDGVAVRVLWTCTGEPGGLLYRSNVLADIDPASRQVVLIRGPAGESQALLTVRENEAVLSDGPPPSAVRTVRRYVIAGIEHILLGYDHIAFLLAVVLWARRLWPVVKIITSFTLAHSVTLSLAALDVLQIPASVVEPAIAASVVCVAAENFISRDIERRWRITFLFGLIHGCGLANALQEFGLPRGAVAMALASFNAGVEVGQIAIVSLVLPTLLAFERMAASRAAGGPEGRVPAVYAASGVIMLLGCYWLLERAGLA